MLEDSYAARLQRYGRFRKGGAGRELHSGSARAQGAEDTGQPEGAGAGIQTADTTAESDNPQPEAD